MKNKYNIVCIVITTLLIIFYGISVLAYPILGNSYYNPTDDSLWTVIIVVPVMTIAGILISIVLFWHPKSNLKQIDKEILAELEIDEDQIANLKFDEKALKELKNISPGKVLAAVLLNEADKDNAEIFVLDKSGNNEEIICKYKVDEKWKKMPSPPLSVWSLVYNIYMNWAGIDYFKSGVQKGKLEHDDLSSQWEFEVNESQDRIIFNRISKIKN